MFWELSGGISWVEIEFLSFRGGVGFRSLGFNDVFRLLGGEGLVFEFRGGFKSKILSGVIILWKREIAAIEYFTSIERLLRNMEGYFNSI